MKVKIFIALLALLVTIVSLKLYFVKKENNRHIFSLNRTESASLDYAGSVSCKTCHEKFYKLWSTSHHGKAMQVVTDSFLATEIPPPMNEDIVVGDKSYRFVIKRGKAYVLENSGKKKKKLPVEYALGGKNVYYFLTPWEKGRLQTLPVAYDLNSKKWFDVAESGVRHLDNAHDEAFHWTEAPYTFNTACHNCHVSQLSKNYDLETDSYHSTWNESGINCETCHGSATEHIKYAQSLTNYDTVTDWKLISTKRFSVEQVNNSCVPCHARMYPITEEYVPGEPFYDHFGITILDNPDYYPDGRDLGENYTFTSWSMNSCVKSGELSCLHCHTSSGRYRFEDDNEKACMPCHNNKVSNINLHSHHDPGLDAPSCIDCHMPKTKFARIVRSDHSMLPPTPRATMEFQSPNACNICHEDKSSAWADSSVRMWHKDDYQLKVMRRAEFIDAARRQDWTKVDQILSYIKDKEAEPVFKASLINLLQPYRGEEKWNVIEVAMKDSSPLVRATACEALSYNQNPSSKQALVLALDDKYRLVRHKAAVSLAYYPPEDFTEEQAQKLNGVIKEIEKNYLALPDQWTSYYNLGNLQMARGDYNNALLQYETSAKFSMSEAIPLINMSLIYNYLGQNEKSLNSLLQALKREPNNSSALFNLGLLYAEMNRINDAEISLKKAFDIDSTLDAAAYNLSTIALSRNDFSSAFEWINKALAITPENPKYSYTYAYTLNIAGETSKAENELVKIINDSPSYLSAYFLLSEIYKKEKNTVKAKGILKRALNEKSLSVNERLEIENAIKLIED